VPSDCAGALLWALIGLVVTVAAVAAAVHPAAGGELEC